MGLLREVKKDARILLMSSPLNETAVSHHPRWVSPKSYPYTLLMLSREEKKLARRLDIPFLDISTRYGELMGLGQVVAQETLLLSRDGVHPAQSGQTFLAAIMLSALGADGNLARVELTVEGDAVKAGKTEGCTIQDVSLADGVITCRRLTAALPYPTPALLRPLAFLAEIDDTLNRDILVVTGAPAPGYRLFIDDQAIAEVSKEELAEGVNLSGYAATPMQQQALVVMEAVRAKNTLEYDLFRGGIMSGYADGQGQATEKATDEWRARLPELHKEIAAAAEKAYGLTTPQWHRIRLEPLTRVFLPYAGLEEAAINQSHLALSLPPLKVDGVSGELIDQQLTVEISNPNTRNHSGEVEMVTGGTWIFTPATVSFQLAPGEKKRLTFAVSRLPNTALFPLPRVSVRWSLDPDWPTLREILRPLEIMPVVKVAERRQPVLLDGDLSEWKGVAPILLNHLDQVNTGVPGRKGLWAGQSDLSATLYYQWDAEALYLAAEVTDSDHRQDASDMMFWSEDCIMLGAQMDPANLWKGRYEFAIGLHSAGEHLIKYRDSAKEAVGPDISFKVKAGEENKSLRYEVRIPWSRLAPFVPEKGQSFRFTVTVNDTDGTPGKGHNYIEWTPGVNYGKNPGDFAQMILE